MDAVIQLLRNAFCCVKNLGWFRGTWLWDASVTGRYLHRLPEPVNQTTPLEVVISILQFYPVVTLSVAGFQMLTGSWWKVRNIQRLIEAQRRETATTAAAAAAPATTGGDKNDDDDDKINKNKENSSSSSSSDKKGQTDLVDKYVTAALIQSAVTALKNMFVGWNIMFIGISFFWLAANSWHVTETDWIGGVPALIHALSVMNVCLLPLLYYMYADGLEYLSSALRMRAAASLLTRKMDQVVDSKGTTPLCLDIELSFPYVELLSDDWKPFWNQDDDYAAVTTKEQDDKRMAVEREKVQAIVDLYLIKKKNDNGDDKKDKDDKKKTTTVGKDKVQDANKKDAVVVVEDITEKEFKIRYDKWKVKAEELSERSVVTRWKGYREFLYLILNSIAFYGYGLCILTYYYPEFDADYNEIKQPAWVQYLKFHMNNQDADWYGNHAGDSCWTIEPAIILASPVVFQWLQQRYQQQASSKKSTAAAASASSSNDKNEKKIGAAEDSEKTKNE